MCYILEGYDHFKIGVILVGMLDVHMLISRIVDAKVTY